MSYSLRVHVAAKRDLDRLTDKIYRRIAEKISNLEENPRPFGCEKMQDQENYRIRVGDFRIVYTIDDKAKLVEIIKIGNRKEIYKKR